MKIGILYICTGNYTVFWDDFYLSAEKNFLPEFEKHYFVFSDGNINTFDNPFVTIIYQQKLGWPFDTLKRFEMFLKVEEELKHTDYAFFFNANVIFNQQVGKEILPEEDQELTVVLHPSFYELKDITKFPYDRNLNSLACISESEGEIYVQGALNGGTSKNFIKMCQQLNTNTENDLSRDVIALWHDESHLNKYILDKKVKVLNPGYICPEGRKLPFEIYIYTRKKKKYGGHKKLRGSLIQKKSIKERFLSLFR